MSNVGRWENCDGIGILTINSPPVNALSRAVRQALLDGFRALASDDDVQAIVLICEGRTFFAGADISEFGGSTKASTLLDVFDIIEQTSKPVVAAIHGTALGGGFELALVCHYRIAVPSAKVGLPEVNLGLLPGAGGTQRLPRIVGAATALELIVGGAPVAAKKARDLGMIDALAEEGRLREDAVALARSLLDEGRPLQRVRDREDKIGPDRGNTRLFSDFRAKVASSTRGFKAPENIIKAVEAAVELPFDQGIAREWELFEELLESSESAAQRYYFFAERETAKVPGVDRATPETPVKSAAVVGTGAGGFSIAAALVAAGIPVTLVEQDSSGKGSQAVRAVLSQPSGAGRASDEQVERGMALVTTTADFGAVAEADLVVSSGSEDAGGAEATLQALGGTAREGAILALSSAWADLDRVAEGSGRASAVLGLHLVAPPGGGRLLEIVRGERTSPEVLATALKLAKRIGSVPVVSKAQRGLIVDRLLRVLSERIESERAGGTPDEAIGRVLYDFGFALEALPGLEALGTQPPPAMQETPDGLRARLLYPVVNEGARILEEGVALRASDVDVACILGFRWPVYTGGPMFWADTLDLGQVVATLDGQSAGSEDRVAPCRLLKEKAASGGTFTRD